MQDEIKQNAIKCSAEMNIPIVFLDKEKIIQHEVTKIEKQISEKQRQQKQMFLILQMTTKRCLL